MSQCQCLHEIENNLPRTKFCFIPCAAQRLLRKEAKTVKLTKEDVWGSFDENHKKLSDGMIVARSEDNCPVWKDKIPFKSVTVVCTVEQQAEVTYWLGYVHGADSVSRVRGIGDGKIAIRSDYQCW